ncbi:MAG: cytochrome c biogenesis CcdA family protein [Anaerotardibacter sp.]
MEYLISFLEGIITFVSPCLLPLIPIYVFYFAGGGQRNTHSTLKGALGFVCGFTVVFLCLGLLAGSLGSLLKEYQAVLNGITGTIVILFGLSYLGVFSLSFLKGTHQNAPTTQMSFAKAFVLGLVFAIGWTPCVGAFLGSALMLASSQAHALKGALMLLAYSLGLGIPFILSAVLIDYLKSAFNWIKAHYQIINTISGIFLIVLGVLMATGTLSWMLGLLGS